MTDLILAHEIPAPLEVLPQDLGNLAIALAKRAGAVQVTDSASMDTASGVLVEMHAAAKEIEKRRTELKKPITQLGKAIDSVCAKVAEPLDKEKRALMARVQEFQRAEQERVERERRAAEEAQRKAETERMRLEAEAKAKAEAEAAELSKVLGTEVKPEPVSVPVVAPVAAAPVKAAPQSNAISTRTVKVLVIDDEAQIPAYVGGVCVRQVDRAAIRKLLDAGVAVPGARIEEQQQVAMRGAR